MVTLAVHSDAGGFLLLAWLYYIDFVIGKAEIFIGLCWLGWPSVNQHLVAFIQDASYAAPQYARQANALHVYKRFCRKLRKSLKAAGIVEALCTAGHGQALSVLTYLLLQRPCRGLLDQAHASIYQIDQPCGRTSARSCEDAL